MFAGCFRVGVDTTSGADERRTRATWIETRHCTTLSMMCARSLGPVAALALVLPPLLLALSVEGVGDGDRTECVRTDEIADADDNASEACRANYSAPSPPPGRYDYCVVGAGPGGLQVASMLREAETAGNASLSVVVFDKAPRAGAFFATMPIHRKLISINKKYFTRRWWVGATS